MTRVCRAFYVSANANNTWKERTKAFSERIAKRRLLPIQFEHFAMVDVLLRDPQIVNHVATSFPSHPNPFFTVDWWRLSTRLRISALAVSEAQRSGTGGDFEATLFYQIDWMKSYILWCLVAGNRCLACCVPETAGNGPFACFRDENPRPTQGYPNPPTEELQREEEIESAYHLLKHPWRHCGFCQPCLRRHFVEKRSIHKEIGLAKKFIDSDLRFFKIHRWTLCLRQIAERANADRNGTTAKASADGATPGGRKRIRSPGDTASTTTGQQEPPSERPLQHTSVERNIMMNAMLQQQVDQREAMLHGSAGAATDVQRQDKNQQQQRSAQGIVSPSIVKGHMQAFNGAIDPLYFLAWPGHSLNATPSVGASSQS